MAVDLPLTPKPTARIKALASLVASQIAAGEVVERPASVVKECVENSIDAGAQRIVVDLEQGGIELIRVADDGAGIASEDLRLAIAAHATSKIESVDDLDHIATLGFRGEALASIAAVSRLSIRSRTAAQESAAEIEVEGDRIAPVRPAPGPPGTTITIRNLFFNTPARRKFLKTTTTEQSRCVDVLRDLALAHASAGFSVSADGRRLLDVPPAQSPKQRAVAILGEDLLSELLEVSADTFDDSRGVSLWGLIGRPSIAKGSNRSQHIFVNGRAIRDKTVQHAVAEAYRGLIEPGRFPTCVIMLEMSPNGVDVNVHPQKAEVRFRDSGHVHSVVLRAMRDALRAADLTPTLSAGPSWGAKFSLRSEDSLPGPTLSFNSRLSDMTAARDQRPDPAPFVEFFRRPADRTVDGRLADATGAETAAVGSTAQSPVRTGDQAWVSSRAVSGPASSASSATRVESGSEGALDGPTPRPWATEAANPSMPQATPGPRLMQIHKSFVVTEDEQGVVIIDQHALHERVMFEYLFARVLGATAEATGPGRLESQPLLVPIVVPAAPAWVDKLTEVEGLLSRIGIEADALGPTTIGLRAFPTFLFERGVDPVEFCTELFTKAESSDFAPGTEETLRDVLDMMSCKAAVKAGDRLSTPELAELVKLREMVDRSSNCPHGRPTSIRLTIRELERLFGRS